MSKVFILSACDEWAGKDSMRIQGVTTDETMLQAMIAKKILSGDMEYGGVDGNKAWQGFLDDLFRDGVDYNKLNYGFVQTFEDVQITEEDTLAEFPEVKELYDEITEEKAGQAVAALGLENHSFLYSAVGISTVKGNLCFNISGFCDRDRLENLNQYKELVKDLDHSEMLVCINTFSVGNGECKDATEEELAALEQYEYELEETYGIEQIQSDYFGFYYEAEQEQD